MTHNESAALPQELHSPCPRGCVDVEGCGCEWNQRREAWPDEPTTAPDRACVRESPFAFRELSRDEMYELRRQRFHRRLDSGGFLDDSGIEPPFTPSEARWHAREFIKSNGPSNLVRMLAEAYIALQDAAAERLGESDG